MASPHVSYIQTSDKEDENEQLQPSEVFDNLYHLGMGNKTFLGGTENEGNQLYEVVNEHDELLHVFSADNVIPQLNPVQSVDVTPQPNQGNVVQLQGEHPQSSTLESHNNNEDPILDFEPPPVPDEMFSNSESETSDTPDYIIDSSEEEEDLYHK